MAAAGLGTSAASAPVSPTAASLAASPMAEQASDGSGTRPLVPQLLLRDASDASPSQRSRSRNVENEGCEDPVAATATTLSGMVRSFYHAEAGNMFFVEQDFDEKELDLYKQIRLGMDEEEEDPDENTVEKDDPLSRALVYVRIQRRLLMSASKAVVEEESKFKAWIEMDEMSLLLEEEKTQKSMRNWARFDSLFGVFVLLNGILMGMTTQGVLQERSFLVQALETCFLLIFIAEWLIRWRFKSTGLKGMLKDKWSIFDLTIILVSLLDSFVLLIFKSSSGASLVTVLRVMRLLRLVRLVRLLKLLKELWMLVNGMMSSTRILLWSLVLLCIICYMFGLFFMEIINAYSISEVLTEPGNNYWSSVPRSMLSMAQIATNSGLVLLRQLHDELGPWILGVVFGFLFMASLGLLNLIIGVLLTSALQLAQRDTCFEEGIHNLTQHRTLRVLRELLIRRCRAQMGESGDSPLITRAMLLEWVADSSPALDQDGDAQALSSEDDDCSDPDRYPSYAFKQFLVAEGSMQTDGKGVLARVRKLLFPASAKEPLGPRSFASNFAEANVSEDEINVIFNEADSVYGKEASISVDDFIQGCILLKGRVHPLDTVQLMNGIKAIYRRMALLQNSMTAMSQVLFEVSAQTTSLLESYYGAKEDAQDDDAKDAAEHAEEAWKMGKGFQMDEKERLLRDQEELLAQTEYRRLQERRNWDRFDTVFSIVVFVNAVVLGIEAELEGAGKVRNYRDPRFATSQAATLWLLVDLAFVAIYFFELCARVIFHYQMTVQQDFRVWGFCLPKLIWIMDRDIKVQVFLSTWRWLKDIRNLMWLDTIIVALSVLDNAVFRVLEMASAYNKFLKLLSLLRLLRFTRLLHLVRPLTTLVLAFMGNVKLIFWCLAMLLVIIYGCAIGFVEFVGKGSDDEIIRKRWGNLLPAMLTLCQMVTFTGWTERVEELGSFAPWNIIVSVLFIGITSLGILNLVTGVMVQAAFHVVVGQQDTKLNHKLNLTRNTLRQAIERAFATVTAGTAVAKVKMRKRINAARRALIDEEVALNAELDKHGLSLSAEEKAKTKLRRSPGTGLIDDDHINFAPTALEDSEEHDPFYQMPMSSYDKNNFCHVMHVTWFAPGTLAVGIATVDDGSRRGPMSDPLLSALIWESGRTGPVLFLSDEGLEEDAAQTLKRPGNFSGREGRVASMELDGEEMAQARAAEDAPPAPVAGGGRAAAPKRFSRLGDLVFSEVPVDYRLYFRFGGNYRTVEIYLKKPGCVDLQSLEEVSLAEAKPVDTEVLSLRELHFLVQDPPLIRQLQQLNLRPEHMLMAYQILNATNSGKVKVSNFIEGLLRTRRQEVGLDTAGAKSLMRRLVMQVAKLCQESVLCRECFMNMVQKLRCVQVTDNMDEDAGEMDPDAAARLRERELIKENQKLKIQCDRLRVFINTRKEVLQIHSDLGSGRRRDKDKDKDDDETASAMSITSASPGWD